MLVGLDVTVLDPEVVAVVETVVDCDVVPVEVGVVDTVVVVGVVVTVDVGVVCSHCANAPPFRYEINASLIASTASWHSATDFALITSPICRTRSYPSPRVYSLIMDWRRARPASSLLSTIRSASLTVSLSQPNFGAFSLLALA